MDFQHICAYDLCQQPFTSRYKASLYCSKSCSSKATVVIDDNDVRTYFLGYADIPGNDLLDKEPCWIWKGHINSGGYGMAFVRKAKIRAHRLAYEIFVAPIPPGLDILHGSTCKMRACASPWHVRPGTNLENMQDRKKYGDQVRGSVHHSAIHTETQALHILQEFHDDGMTVTEIAKKRHTHMMTIHDIIHRKTWTHVAPGKYPVPGDQRAIINKTIAEEIRYLREQEEWSYKHIAEKFNLKYGTVIDICTYRTWNISSAMPEDPLPEEPQEPLTEVGIRQMRQDYIEACANATAQGRKVRITPFAERYARKFGMTNMAARMILKCQTWKHVTL